MSGTSVSIEAPFAGSRRWVFRHRGLLGVEALWLAFAANFNVGFLWGGDSQVAYAFVRRLFGSGHPATGYQFGLALFEAPFYGLGRLLERAGIETIRTHPTPEVAIAAGAVFYVGAAVALAYVVLARLGFRRPALAAGAALFGSPLFYYGTFSPGQTHAVDTLLASAAILLLCLAHARNWPLKPSVALGIVLGIAPTVRYFESMLGVAVVAMLCVARRWRPAAVVAASGAVTLGLLLLLPAAVGVQLFGGGAEPGNAIAFSPASPFHMLFGPQRGLFLWTPLTLLAVVGFVRILSQSDRHRWLLTTVAAMAVLLVAVQVGIPFWYAGWSFSQRYLTALYPIVAIGFAGLLDWRPRLGILLATPAVAWSLFLCLTMQTVGFDEHHDTVFSLARRAATQSPGAYAYGVWRISHLRVLVPVRPAGWR